MMLDVWYHFCKAAMGGVSNKDKVQFEGNGLSVTGR